ncbi:hypothetical protein BDW22DRAFT_1326619 [Trametopsis cervina]|nr:hypothetical protein BDW22DRAFT_1326619 [Trametopsis cervina]
MVVPTGILFLASVSPCLDITQEIKIDHDNVRDLFSRFKQSTDAKDETLIANTLIREMSVHGNAGEVSVYNDYSPLGLDDAVKHNKGEHATVKKLVRKAEHAPASMKNYDVILAEAAEAFLQHASEGEAEQFPKLLEKSLVPAQEIARAFIRARGSVPTRPHPLSPQTGGLFQKAMGMHGRAQDKVVESLRGRGYVGLGFKHPEV